MLILAGVALSMVMGDESIIDQANSATEKTKGADVYETVEIAVGNNKSAKYSGMGTTTKQEVVDQLYIDGKITAEEKADIEEDWKITIGNVEVDFNKLDEQNITSSSITNDNIGDYIDLGNNIIGTESTADDWRILYVDGSTIYAILADYLPAAQVPTSAGLNTDVTKYLYSVWIDTDRDTLVNGLKNEAAWSTFTNGIVGATATGSPTSELLMSSYNIKNGTELVYTDYPKLDSGVEDYNLYVPHTEAVSDCNGYWLASPRVDFSLSVWFMGCDGLVGDSYYALTEFSARPVVSLPSSITAELVDGVWTVSQ